MKILSLILAMLIITSFSLGGCYTMPRQIELTDGVKEKTKKLHKDSVLIAISPNGGTLLLDVEGNVAEKCTPPVNRTKEQKKNYKYQKGECVGTGFNFITKNNVNGVLISRPNPHSPCLICYDKQDVTGAWVEKCYPSNCKH